MSQTPQQPAGTTVHGALWGGRFASGPSAALAALSKSTHFDWRLAPHDVRASMAHARVLRTAGLLDDEQLASMLEVLQGIHDDVVSGALQPAADDEDVHGALERVLLERAGADLGGRLRAGRSRNDQIATLLRMHLRSEAGAVRTRLLELAAQIAKRQPA